MFNPKKYLYSSAHRLLLDNKLSYIFKKYSLHKSREIIDFGSGNPRYKFLAPNSEWIFFDKFPSNEYVNYADTKKIPYKKADTFLCLEVLQYLESNEIENLFAEIQRLIKYQGKAILSIPFLYPIDHKEISRFSKRFFNQNLFKKNFEINIYEFGNFFSFIHDLLFSKVYYLESKLFKKIFLVLLIPLKYLSLKINKQLFSISSGFIIVFKTLNKN